MTLTVGIIVATKSIWVLWKFYVSQYQSFASDSVVIDGTSRSLSLSFYATKKSSQLWQKKKKKVRQAQIKETARCWFFFPLCADVQ